MIKNKLFNKEKSEMYKEINDSIDNNSSDGYMGYITEKCLYTDLECIYMSFDDCIDETNSYTDTKFDRSINVYEFKLKYIQIIFFDNYSTLKKEFPERFYECIDIIDEKRTMEEKRTFVVGMLNYYKDEKENVEKDEEDKIEIEGEYDEMFKF